MTKNKQIDEMITFLSKKKDACMNFSKNYPDKSKRTMFKYYASAYVDALNFAKEIKKNIS